MIYAHRCNGCGEHADISKTVEGRNDTVLHECGGEFERIYTPPQIITQPFHLQEFNRFKGDGTDYLQYRRKYDRMWDTREERQKETATIDAQMAGAEVMKAKPTKSLAETIHEHGVPVRG